MKKLILLLAAILLTTPLAVCADPPAGRGHGNFSPNYHHGNYHHGKYHGKVPGVPTAVPPGIAKKGSVPYGLSKKNKTPPGWNKGEKQGWSRSLHDDLFGR